VDELLSTATELEDFTVGVGVPEKIIPQIL